MLNLFDDLPPLPPAGEAAETICEVPGMRVERIVSSGHTTGWYDQDVFEFVALLEGDAVIEYSGGRTIRLRKGDTLVIPPHERHRVAYTSASPPCVWLCVFTREEGPSFPTT